VTSGQHPSDMCSWTSPAYRCRLTTGHDGPHEVMTVIGQIPVGSASDGLVDAAPGGREPRQEDRGGKRPGSPAKGAVTRSERGVESEGTPADESGRTSSELEPTDDVPFGKYVAKIHPPADGPERDEVVELRKRVVDLTAQNIKLRGQLYPSMDDVPDDGPHIAERLETVLGKVVAAMERARDGKRWDIKSEAAFLAARQLWDEVHNAVEAASRSSASGEGSDRG
jgi:hypothetical protein